MDDWGIKGRLAPLIPADPSHEKDRFDVAGPGGCIGRRHRLFHLVIQARPEFTGAQDEFTACLT